MKKFTKADVKFADGTERKNAQIYMSTWFGYPAFYAKHKNKDVEVTLKNGEYIQKWEDKDAE